MGKLFKSGASHPKWKGGRKTHRGYVMVTMRGHPRATAQGYVYEHIVVAEAALGRHLPERHPVHHVDGNGLNNEPSNLVVCEDRAYHNLIHRRLRALEGCGNASAKRCFICKEYSDQSDMRGHGYRTFHRLCASRKQREKRARQREAPL